MSKAFKCDRCERLLEHTQDQSPVRIGVQVIPGCGEPFWAPLKEVCTQCFNEVQHVINTYPELDEDD